MDTHSIITPSGLKMVPDSVVLLGKHRCALVLIPATVVKFSCCFIGIITAHVTGVQCSIAQVPHNEQGVDMRLQSQCLPFAT